MEPLTQSTAPAPPPPVLQDTPTLRVVTPADVIAMVRGMLKECTWRVEAYRHAPFYQVKLGLIHSVYAAMNDATAVATPSTKVKLVLAQERNLLLLAPGRPIKRTETYKAKVQEIMAACREYLGWRAQQ